MRHIHFSQRRVVRYEARPPRRRGIGFYTYVILCDGLRAVRQGTLRSENWDDVTCPKCLALRPREEAKPL